VSDADPLAAEQQRIAAVYAGREQSQAPGIYSEADPANRYLIAQRERATLGLLRDHGITLAGREILEVGCGHGAELARLAAWGAEERRLTGIDLLGERIAAARERLPEANLRVADARRLPFPGGSFDLVMQVTLFSSIVDAAIRDQAAAEMRRVLRPGGHILWCDMWVVRPDRPLVAMPEREIRRLFPGCAADIRRAVLNPLIARQIAKTLPWLCDLLTNFPPFRAYNIALLTCDSSF
jgi:ubiquinone/menaquinone biosynthesis C-methylase UbiE